jgi:excisionase family DNA binding protein
VTKTPDLIGSAEAADMLGIDRSTLSRWIAAGRIKPYQKLPGATGSIVFDRAAVQRLADELAAEAS